MDGGRAEGDVNCYCQHGGDFNDLPQHGKLVVCHQLTLEIACVQSGKYLGILFLPLLIAQCIPQSL